MFGKKFPGARELGPGGWEGLPFGRAWAGKKFLEFDRKSAKTFPFSPMPPNICRTNTQIRALGRTERFAPSRRPFGRGRAHKEIA